MRLQRHLVCLYAMHVLPGSIVCGFSLAYNGSLGLLDDAFFSIIPAGSKSAFFIKCKLITRNSSVHIRSSI